MSLFLMIPFTKLYGYRGFSLTEVLIGMALMGILASFSIPSLLQVPESTQAEKYTGIAQSTAYMIMSAYEQYRAVNPTVSMSTTAGDLTPYMNYLNTDTSATVDDWQTGTTWGCNTNMRCLVLHNGAKLVYDKENFNTRSGSASKDNILLFQLDPDGVYSGTTNGPGKALAIVLYYDGYIGTQGTARANSFYKVTYPGQNFDPPWFTGF
jgi:prepilin-type N-terminal cleavage/methylation domain-containing protein